MWVIPEAITSSGDRSSLMATDSLLKPPKTYPLKSFSELNICSNFLYSGFGEGGVEAVEETAKSRRPDPEIE